MRERKHTHVHSLERARAHCIFICVWIQVSHTFKIRVSQQGKIKIPEADESGQDFPKQNQRILFWPHSYRQDWQSCR